MTLLLSLCLLKAEVIAAISKLTSKTADKREKTMNRPMATPDEIAKGEAFHQITDVVDTCANDSPGMLEPWKNVLKSNIITMNMKHEVRECPMEVNS